MPFFEFNQIKISAVCAAVPTEIVKVDSFAERFGKDYVNKFKESTGIKEFRRTKEHQTASDLCYSAAEKIIEEKGISRDEIGILIFVAHSTDYRRPATACVLQKRLKLSVECAAFDISLGCSAFVYGLQIVASLLETSNTNKALLLVGETLTKMVHPKDKSVAMLFGDGGSAVLVEKTKDSSNIIKGILKSDGNGYRAIIAPAGGFRNINPVKKDFIWKDGNIRTLYNTIMQGEDVFAFTISTVTQTIKEFLEETQTKVNDYDCLAFHQANQFIHKMLCKKLKVDAEKMPICLDRYGNPSAPAIPLVICDRYGNSDCNERIKFLICGFGVGLSWGVCSVEINTEDIFPIIESDEIFKEGIINTPDDLYQ